MRSLERFTTRRPEDVNSRNYPVVGPRLGAQLDALTHPDILAVYLRQDNLDFRVVGKGVDPVVGSCARARVSLRDINVLERQLSSYRGFFVEPRFGADGALENRAGDVVLNNEVARQLQQVDDPAVAGFLLQCDKGRRAVIDVRESTHKGIVVAAYEGQNGVVLPRGELSDEVFVDIETRQTWAARHLSNILFRSMLENEVIVGDKFCTDLVVSSRDFCDVGLYFGFESQFQSKLGEFREAVVAGVLAQAKKLLIATLAETFGADEERFFAEMGKLRLSFLKEQHRLLLDVMMHVGEAAEKALAKLDKKPPRLQLVSS